MGVYGEDTRIHASLLSFIGSLVNSAHVTRFASWYQSPSTKSVHQLTKNSNNQSFRIFCVISSHFLLRDQKSTPTKTKKHIHIENTTESQTKRTQKWYEYSTPTCVGKFRLQAAVQVLNRPHQTLMDEADLFGFLTLESCLGALFMVRSCDVCPSNTSLNLLKSLL